MTFTPDEIDTIKALLNDWGFEYSLTADRAKVIALCKKLKLDKLADNLKID